MAEQDFISLKDLCAELHIDVTTMYRWQKSGKAPKSYKLGTQIMRFKRDEVDAWLAGNEVQQGATA